MRIPGKAPLKSLPRLLDDHGCERLCMSGIRMARRLVRVDSVQSEMSTIGPLQQLTSPELTLGMAGLEVEQPSLAVAGAAMRSP